MQPLLERYLDAFKLAKLESLLAKPLAKARETGLSLYCGEWGAVSNAPKEDRLRWCRDMIGLNYINRGNVSHENGHSPCIV